METRLNVLISAYACEPGKGSEPGTSWEWVSRLARYHDLTVVTRANNRPSIESVLSSFPPQCPLPKFVYHDLADPVLTWKKRLPAGTQWYYYLWQLSAHHLVAKLLQKESFDLLHHLSFATYRFPTAIWNQGVPCVWGPVAGVENTPGNLLPWRHPSALAGELGRNSINFLQSSRFSRLAGRAACSTVVVAVSPEMQRALARLGCEAVLLPTIAVYPPAEITRFPAGGDQPLRLLFVGRILYWKGVELALYALGESRTPATLTFIGDGPFRRAAQSVAHKLGLKDRVHFLGRRPYAETVQAYSSYDVLLNPSIHDSGSNVALEAMSYGLPVICLDCAGPGFLVPAGGGIKVQLGTRREVIQGLSEAIRQYDQTRALIKDHGMAARRHVLEHHTWERQAQQMTAIYHQAVSA